MPKSNIQVSTKQLLSISVLLITAIAGLGTVHAVYVLPGVMREARIQTTEMIESHADHPHASSVSRNEFNLLKAQLDRIEEIVNR